MAQLNPTLFVDDATVVLRKVEVPAADFDGGGNLCGSNAVGLGINMAAGPVVGTPEQFTLLDQHGNARAAQISQHIGGSGYTDPTDYPSSGGDEGTLPDSVIATGPNPDEGDGTIVVAGNATLASLAAGWTAVP